jgi:adenylate cyclase
MRMTIGIKVFSIAIGLLMLMGAAALLNLRMTHAVDAQFAALDDYYVPSHAALAQANTRSLEESAFIRRLMLAFEENPRNEDKISMLYRRAVEAAASSDAGLADFRRLVNGQLLDALSFADNVALGRLDTHVQFLQEHRKNYEDIFAKLLDATRNRQPDALSLLDQLDALRDDFDRRITDDRIEMHRLIAAAIDDTRDYQHRVVVVGLVLLVVAALLGITVAAIVTLGLVRPVRRLLAGTAAVEGGALETVVPITSRDEIGTLTRAFNMMVGELRTKALIRETFGKYVDPRIVAGLLDRPELTNPKGARREMTILFCDMRGFTSFSEGMTPVGLVTVLNRYLTVLSDPVRRNGGIIDKYIGDAVMAFWGPPFAAAEDQARLACLSAIEQLAALPAFQQELPELTGLRRGLPQIAIRVGIATGEVVVGNIGSEQTRNYTVIGDTVNVASRLEGASKAYGTHILIGERTRQLAAAAIETREIDSVIVVGKSEPERIFEVLGRAGEIAAERLALRDAFAGALAAYRRCCWDAAKAGFEHCLELAPDDGPSQTFLARVAHFREMPPEDDWNGVWSMTTK